ncbi:hypothetical protein P3T76_007446 [Phytophthora citrophthora]|uniref:Uncharacterized protein n=1 Tax=Phytophthora citrophthora TaxID=4793 RepID=A0AAD9GNB0_9STRA|nr:hypothetical protein P3T76_007446 [Phytophthora citrophthora]
MYIRAGITSTAETVTGERRRTNFRAYSASRSAPVLTLRLFPSYDLDATQRAQALRAFSVLMEHLRQLRDYPDLKRKFWLDVLHSSMVWKSTRHVPNLLCEIRSSCSSL